MMASSYNKIYNLNIWKKYLQLLLIWSFKLIDFHDTQVLDSGYFLESQVELLNRLSTPRKPDLTSLGEGSVKLPRCSKGQPGLKTTVTN